MFYERFRFQLSDRNIGSRSDCWTMKRKLSFNARAERFTGEVWLMRKGRKGFEIQNAV